jgi:outer membrane murein-binding lipoprotein Lpp
MLKRLLLSAIFFATLLVAGCGSSADQTAQQKKEVDSVANSLTKSLDEQLAKELAGDSLKKDSALADKKLTKKNK